MLQAFGYCYHLLVDLVAEPTINKQLTEHTAQQEIHNNGTLGTIAHGNHLERSHGYYHYGTDKLQHDGQTEDGLDLVTQSGIRLIGEHSMYIPYTTISTKEKFTQSVRSDTSQWR